MSRQESCWGWRDMAVIGILAFDVLEGRVWQRSWSIPSPPQAGEVETHELDGRTWQPGRRSIAKAR